MVMMTEFLPDETRTELRRLRDAGTEGPWAIWRDLDHQGFYTVGDAESYQEVVDTGMTEECNPTAHVYIGPDAELIVAAVNNLAALLDENDHFRRENAELDAHAEYMSRELPGVQKVIDDLRRENARLDSLTRQVNTCAHTDPATWPDDTEANQCIAEAESFTEAIWEIGEKYGVPLTNNFNPRWQDGVFVRDVSDFLDDVRDAAVKHLVAPLRAELETARAAYALTINAMEGEITENNGVIRALGHRRDSGET